MLGESVPRLSFALPWKESGENAAHGDLLFKENIFSPIYTKGHLFEVR